MPGFQLHAQDLMGHTSSSQQSRDVWEVLGSGAATADDLAPIPHVITCSVLILSLSDDLEVLFLSQTFRSELSRV